METLRDASHKNLSPIVPKGSYLSFDKCRLATHNKYLWFHFVYVTEEAEERVRWLANNKKSQWFAEGVGETNILLEKKTNNRFTFPLLQYLHFMHYLLITTSIQEVFF